VLRAKSHSRAGRRTALEMGEKPGDFRSFCRAADCKNYNDPAPGMTKHE
jgi:hypothetical protein